MKLAAKMRRARSISPHRVSVKGNKRQGEEADKLPCPYCGKECKGSRGVNVHIRHCKLVPTDPVLNAWLIKNSIKPKRSRSWSGLDAWTDQTGNTKQFIKPDIVPTKVDWTQPRKLTQEIPTINIEGPTPEETQTLNETIREFIARYI